MPEYCFSYTHRYKLPYKNCYIKKSYIKKYWTNQYSKFFHLIIFGQLDENNIILKSSYNKLVQNIL